ncbi:ribosomal protein L2 [Phlegmacium glaucopus]|nr:ribosomal protein L2 [Phlegmacium glaucopus]
MFSSVRSSSTTLLRNRLTIPFSSSSSPPTKCLAAAASLLHSTTNSKTSTFSLSQSSQRRSYVTEIWKNAKPNDVSTALARTKDLYKTYKPVSPGIRHLRRPLNPHIYEGRPIRSLTIARRKNGGRNQHGVITVRHRGGGHKQRIRILDYKREAPGIHDVIRIEYDPGRSAHIALLQNRDPKAIGSQKWSYIIATEGLRAGDQVQSFRQGIPEGFIPGFDSALAEKSTTQETEDNDAGYSSARERMESSTESSAQSLAVGLLRSLTLKPGNVLPLRLIPAGTVINTVALSPTGPGILVRSAGSFAQVVGYEEGSRYVQVRLQSGEVRKILRDCCATIGKVSNTLWKNRSLGKAGRSRWLGIRPSVRGVAMNANDHPHGGGRGKSKSNKHPVSIWGWGTKGTRTRKPGPKGPKNSNKMVIRERPRGKEKQGLA